MWQNVIDPNGSPRDLTDAGVVELTGLLRHSVGPDGNKVDQLKAWPRDMRVIVRREPPLPPGAQLSLFEEADGWRYQVFATNQDSVPGDAPVPAPTSDDASAGRNRAAVRGPEHHCQRPS